MKNPIICILLLLLPVLCNCSSDLPPERSEKEILGIWSDGKGQILDFESLDRAYGYYLFNEEGDIFWGKFKLMYFFEPYNYLLCLQDTEGVMQMYKVVAVSPQELKLCWVATPELGSEEEGSRFDFLKIFFDKTYTVDEALMQTLRRVPPTELKSELGDYEVYEAF